MAKFDAATAIEGMEYDFTKYGGSEGEIPEPTTGQVNAFMAGMRATIREARSIMDVKQDLSEEMSAEEMAEQLDNVDESLGKAEEFQKQIIRFTADLCSQHPSEDDLSKLPIRVLRAFSKWLMLQLNPKEEGENGTARSLPAPTDRRPASKRSRAGRR